MWAQSYAPIWMLDWMFLHGGYDLSPVTYYLAVTQERMNVMDWLYRHGVPIKRRSSCFIYSAMENTPLNLTYLDWFHERGYRSNESPASLYGCATRHPHP